MTNQSQETQLKNSLKIFSAKARKKHSNKYTYDPAEYKGNFTPISFTCKKHGVFKHKPYWYVNSNAPCRGCLRDKKILAGLNSYKTKFFETHGKKYIYDWMSWENANAKMRIKCRKHGWFEQLPYDHLKNNGCRECFKLNHSKVLSKPFSLFLAKARRTHGNRFEYDEKSWRGSQNKVRIKCGVHGWFEQIPHDHLKLQGCRKCSTTNMNATSWTEAFMAFTKKHGERYFYKKETYVNMSTPMTIVCADHGDFQQKPTEHILRQGCAKCSGRHRWTTEEFIERAKQAHKEKYTYTKSVYIGATDPITITCPDHGDFVTQPARHVLSKHGCAKCRGYHRTTEEFIELSKKRFGLIYDYSQTRYKNTGTFVTIICRHHGPFKQKAKDHLVAAIGCPQCSYNVSGKEISWLDSLELPPSTQRGTRVNVMGKMRNVDAFNPETNTVYEFWGDWWHGNPRVFPCDGIHAKTGKTYGDLYDETMDKRQAIADAGYSLVEIWEDEFDKLVSSQKIIHKIKPKYDAWCTHEHRDKKILDRDWEKLTQCLGVSVNYKIEPRTVADAAYWVLKYGGTWRALPKDIFGKLPKHKSSLFDLDDKIPEIQKRISSTS